MSRVIDQTPSDDDDDPELAEAIRLSLKEPTYSSGAGPSKLSSRSGRDNSEEVDLLKALDGLDYEITDVQRKIKELQQLDKELTSQRKNTARRLEALREKSSGVSISGKAKGVGLLDYSQDFHWTPVVRSRLNSTFKIKAFRLCQEAVCNANMDGRDIVCVMPTGGGKSLTYQLPAVLTLGVTIVVSPLISLMHDQVLHLREFGVEAEVLASHLSKPEQKSVQAQLRAVAHTRRAEDGLKLCYMAPEQLRNSYLRSILSELYEAKRLARFVIDEAHCVSTLGHDFRPEYQKLAMLRNVFERVPILALSATCPPRVLNDLTKTLRLEKVVDGRAADRKGSVYFSSPLYRKNLHYKVLPKPPSKEGVIKAMVNYIQEHHADDSGIIYCLSKKDTEQVAAAIREESGGRIKTGVYHAEVNDKHKMRLHEDWRKGVIKVVCATIAFGLGIDKGDVRFVIHHTMSKSMDGFYQESGRAGRDGKDADCILYYRAQDGSRLSTLIANEREKKVYKMIEFAIDVARCRKLLFAEYFQMSSQVGINAWSTEEEDGHKVCGHCDNCIRDPESVEQKDVTLAAWKILKVAQAIENASGRATLTQLVTIACGGKGQFSIVGAKKKSLPTSLDVDEVAGGRVDLSKHDTETLCTHLLVRGYLKEDLVPTAYTWNAYLAPAVIATRLTRFTLDEVETGTQVPRFKAAFLTAEGKRKKPKSAKAPKKKQIEPTALSEIELTPVPTDKERKPLDFDSDDGIYSVDDDSLSDRITGTFTTGDSSWTSMPSDSEDDDSLLQWEESLRKSSKSLKHSASRPASTRPTKRVKINKGKSKARPTSPEVIELSSD